MNQFPQRPKKQPEPEPQSTKPKVRAPGLLDGFKDRLPSDAALWSFAAERMTALTRDFSFTQVATPILEDPRLYASLKSAGEPFGEELLTFEHPVAGKMAFRPENTLALARAYREHGLAHQPQPVRLAFMGPQVRYLAKPSAGRYRQFHQFGLAVFGDKEPVMDAQTIAAVFFLLQELGLDVRLHLNTLGNEESRKQYEQLLVEHFKTRKSALDDYWKHILAKRPLEILHCREPQYEDLFQGMPQIVDHLTDADRDHFVRVLEHLDEVEVSYALDPRLIHNTGIHNQTVAAFFPARGTRTHLSLASGGRADKLVELVGGEPTPAFTLSLGMERVVTAMHEQNVKPPAAYAPQVFLAQLGDAARKKSLKLFLNLRREGIRVAESLSTAGIKDQLEAAVKLGTPFAIIIGQKEIMDETILIRDMENGIQEVIDFQKVIPEIKKRLAAIVAKTVLPGEGMPIDVTPPAGS